MKLIKVQVGTFDENLKQFLPQKMLPLIILILY